ncbi:MAG: GGDEF domain-containing protein [Lachnospiraceae bacterium]|uniref:bifunctional diguanylate cyclase/phosphodiesterase n=1 Tax=uncultured Acetatifactor sp. TaxID=1671927 RepID=UPI00260B066B|nr:GGDEF domain-containing protein [uncultured Acetatifactor sp.]MCI8790214.1 GGDEF domain-containing protein [Lachnospiraceae bacterium]
MDTSKANAITYDSMTGLRDRMTFFADIKRNAAAGRFGQIVLIQLTQLMRINRKYGVPVGDALLRAIAAYLKGLDVEAVAYRIANSRLVLFRPEGTREQAAGLAGDIQARFREIWSVDQEGQRQEIMARAHVIHFPLRLKDTENDLLDKMNYAVTVFHEKASEGVLFFGDELNADMQHKKYVMEEVRYAVENKTFQIYYQPIYDCREGRFTSAESLIRLFARDGSFISPGEFIPMAEENGLIDGISWIVLEKVCCFLGEHPDLPLKTVSVNMTGQQVLDPTFIGRIEANLEKYHLDGSHLRIEITERTVTEDFAEVRKVMEELSRKGIHFYLDDFGTGYSNLSSMLSLPFEVIKFDQSLIQIMNDTEKGQKTISLLADIMHENNYCVVAEGIETAVQVESAHENSLDRIQGFYYAKPMSEEALERFLGQEGNA